MLGPRWDGPNFGVRYTASLISESASEGPWAGDHLGGSTRTMIRSGMGLFGADFGYRRISAGGNQSSLLNMSGLLGVQLGSGLISPYAAIAGRLFYDGENNKEAAKLQHARNQFLLEGPGDVAKQLPARSLGGDEELEG